jgi:hypothetical protein
MKGHGEKFDRKMEAAIVALLAEPTIAAAAKAAGVSYTSLWRWLQEPEFQTEYRKAKRDAFGQATAQLQQAASAAVKCLKEIIEDTKAPSSSRVMAARTVLEMGLKGIELEDLEARLAVIERTVNSGKDRVTPINNAR